MKHNLKLKGVMTDCKGYKFKFTEENVVGITVLDSKTSTKWEVKKI